MDIHDKSNESPAPTPAKSTNDSTDEILFSTNLFTEYKLAGNTEISLRTTICLSSLSRFKQHCASDEALVKLFVSYC
jgi:hypothetical protein